MRYTVYLDSRLHGHFEQLGEAAWAALHGTDGPYGVYDNTTESWVRGSALLLAYITHRQRPRPEVASADV
jgi:hypothetical protein